ncbi:hypothetical protein AZI86_12620 [Bdellovibrio bacteriovorus]|uniref:Uncharacterized protein n=1 Tax=Bdellovibrio bacteriovorus TaxID=959 RepID=A0A150WIP9_BDEBC|nr:hypothetical protein [Bdellovibrio bacteriovorus]KYG63667.1 hypothetical protein AZI86_12620 [Bdellovibrio bacteriovorus]
MKFLVILSLLVGSLAAQASRIEDGGSVGNGGDPIALEFLRHANSILDEVSEDFETYPELQGKDLRSILKTIKVAVTNEVLIVEAHGRQQESTMINYPAKNMVVINRFAWWGIATREYKMMLIFHEILGLAGLEKTMEYPISQRYRTPPETPNNQVHMTSSPLPIIPSKAVSCYSQKITSPNETPTQDVESDYFRIPTIAFSRKDSSKDLVISTIRITWMLRNSDGTPGPIGKCIIAGDQLRALSNEWWIRGTEALVPRNLSGRPSSFQTNCAAYCGGLQLDHSNFTTTADVDVFGLERDKDGEETPVKMNTSIVLQAF